MNEIYQRSMRAAVDRLYDELAADPDSLTGVVVTSAKKTFFAGGNLSVMVQARPEHAPRIFAEVEAMKSDLRRLEKLPKPVVAAINGAALGGGFEITLACQHRILLDDPKAEVGLPEASLGLLPGAGGVTSVTRMLGLQSATDGRAAAGHAVQTGRRAEKAAGARAGRHARGAGAGRQELDPRASR